MSEIIVRTNLIGLIDLTPTGYIKSEEERDCLLETEETVLREHGVSAFV